jgi:hypothetical protein
VPDSGIGAINMYTKTYWITNPEASARFIALWENAKQSACLHEDIKDWMDLLRHLEEKGLLRIEYTKSRALFSKLSDKGNELAATILG